MREWETPALAGDVLRRMDIHPDLLTHFARHALLHRLTRLHVAGQRAVDAGAKRGERASSNSSPRVTRTIMLGESRG